MTSLSEQLFLISFDPVRGKATANPQLALQYALAGAVVMDLVINRGSRLVDGKFTAGPDTGDPVLDDALTRIRTDRKPRDVKHWVRKLAGRPASVQGRIVQQLLSRGVLAQRDSRVLGIRIKRYGLRDQTVRETAMARLRAAVSVDSPVDSVTASLVALASACGLVDRVVDKDQRSAARSRAKVIARGDAAGEAVAGAVREVEAAVMAGVIAAVAASSVTSSGHGH